MTDTTNPSEFENKRGHQHSHIKGWGIDADPKNDPTYPMKKRTDAEIRGYNWERPEQQSETVEVLHSVERPNITAVFGTSNPPSGLSGMIRRKAFQYSESSFGHWIPLVLADRINEVEGILDDLRHGHFPNLFAEHGLKSEWKYNRKKFLIKSAATLAITAGIGLWFAQRKSRNRS